MCDNALMSGFALDRQVDGDIVRRCVATSTWAVARRHAATAVPPRSRLARRRRNRARTLATRKRATADSLYVDVPIPGHADCDFFARLPRFRRANGIVARRPRSSAAFRPVPLSELHPRYTPRQSGHWPNQGDSMTLRSRRRILGVAGQPAVPAECCSPVARAGWPSGSSAQTSDVGGSVQERPDSQGHSRRRIRIRWGCLPRPSA